jgi:uncharacterized membrane protein
MTAVDWIVTLLLSAAPVAELRGGLPYALARGAAPGIAFAVAVSANLAVVPVLLLLLARIDRLLQRWGWTRTVANWVFSRTRNKSRLVRQFGAAGLVLLVAIPLPGTGAWTGCMAAFLLGMPMRRALPLIALGVIVAGLLVLLAGLGVLELSRTA